MWLFLEPIDVWLFRDGRPFDAGSDHRAASLFPPYPSVVQGAIRSHHLVVKNVNLHDKKAIADAVGTTDNYKDLKMRGPFLARREGSHIVRYFPQPADAVTVDKKRHILKPASPPRSLQGLKTSVPTPYLLGLDDEPTKGEGGLWLPEENLLAYLGGGKVAGIPGDALFVRESRFGIGLDHTRRTTQEGALYEVEFIRPCKDVGLLVEVNGYDEWPQEGILRIGGEGHGARFVNLKDNVSWPSPPNPLPHRFKVYFATPTYFENGWQPQTWSKFFERSVPLQAAALNRYEAIGGHDWSKDPRSAEAHKPSRRYVPAGSVYYFEGDARLKGDAITDFGAEIGFGQIIIKEW
ncbi:MAG: type III-B CRISPR module-associated protein Cmr3 [Anaerolineae bacterium]|nr:type III-B CRISPR module-associated protein Cmr3 [Anaerolineae bacterium]